MDIDEQSRQSISMLINYFLSIREGNDAYTLRFNALMLIYKIAGLDFPDDEFNVRDLYNLQYNYEHYCLGSTASNIEMLDYMEKRIKGHNLESRLQVILNKMFLALAPIIKKYGVMINLPVK